MEYFFIHLQAHFLIIIFQPKSKKIMATKPYAQELTEASVMASGIKTNEEALLKRGITAAFAAEIQSMIDACTQLNNEQEALKAKLKEKTEEFTQKMEELKAKTSEARKIIKLDIPQSHWKEFGIADKK